MRDTHYRHARQQHQQQQLLTPVLAGSSIDSGYDFNRNRSSESTEPAFVATPKPLPPKAVTPMTPPRQFSLSRTMIRGPPTSFHPKSYGSEGRSVPISPKQIPTTPPRELSSPYKSQAQPSIPEDLEEETTQVAQPVLTETPSGLHRRQPFLRPSTTHQQHSSWRAKDASSIFRTNAVVYSRDNEDLFTIHRCNAFDEDSDSESDAPMGEF